MKTEMGKMSDVCKEELIRSDQAYSSYHHQNVNLCRPSGTHVGSAIGDGRSRATGDLIGRKEERVMQPANEWSADGLIGLSGSQHKRIADMVQNDTGKETSVSRHPSRPSSRAFEGTESFESHVAFHHELASLGTLYSGTNTQDVSSFQGISSSVPQTYASTMGASLSRNTTPDPQVVVRSPNPRISVPSNVRNANVPNLYDEVSPSLPESADLIASLSDLSLSMDSLLDERNHPIPRSRDEFDAQHNLFHLQRNTNPIKQHSYLNENLKGPRTPILNSGGSSPSQYFNMSSPTSSLSNYGLGAYPASPLVLGNHVGIANIPPLVENVTSGTAIGLSRIDTRALGNHSSADALGMALMDPSYLHYLRSNGYSAATHNDLRRNRESLANSHVDSLALQRAYFDAMLQKSQYGLALGRSNTLTNGFHGNSAFGPGFPYRGNPLGGPPFPNSPVIRSVGPVRHMEPMMPSPSSVRNIGGNFVGPWPSQLGYNLEENFGASLLDEFKENKTRCFELAEIEDHVVEFSADQYGSRFIQQKLETASKQEKTMVFHEIMPQALSLMTDVFGNYVIQKFFEHGSPSQIRKLAEKLFGHVLTLSLQMYGCRVIQKAIEVVDLDQQVKMVTELDGHVMRCVRDQNGNHVIQKCIECIPEVAIQFIVTTVYDQVVTLSTHPYGCRVIQRVLEHCHSPRTQSILMDEILQSVGVLAQDQYGNYVIQHVLEYGKPHERSAIISQLIGKIVEMSQQKFASNVVEKCLSFGTPEERQALVHEMLGSTDVNEPLQVMMKDQFANYVVQKVLETCDDQQLELLLNRIKDHLNALKKYTYGKHIVARVEKLVAAGERRISILSSNSA